MKTRSICAAPYDLIFLSSILKSTAKNVDYEAGHDTSALKGGSHLEANYGIAPRTCNLN